MSTIAEIEAGLKQGVAACESIDHRSSEIGEQVNRTLLQLEKLLKMVQARKSEILNEN